MGWRNHVLPSSFRTFGDVFSNRLGYIEKTHLVEYEIHQEEGLLVMQATYQMTRDKPHHADAQINDSCERDIAHPSNST